MLSCHLVALTQKSQDKCEGLGPPESSPGFWGEKEATFRFPESLRFPEEGEGPRLEMDGGATAVALQNQSLGLIPNPPLHCLTSLQF